MQSTSDPGSFGRTGPKAAAFAQLFPRHGPCSASCQDAKHLETSVLSSLFTSTGSIWDPFAPSVPSAGWRHLMRPCKSTWEMRWKMPSARGTAAKRSVAWLGSLGDFSGCEVWTHLCSPAGCASSNCDVAGVCRQPNTPYWLQGFERLKARNEITQ